MLERGPSNRADTQVNVSIAIADEQLRDDVQQVKVTVSRLVSDVDDLERARWSAPASTVVEKNEIVQWPIDIPVVPEEGVDASSYFEVVVEARAGKVVLAQARGITRFIPRRWLRFPLLVSQCTGRRVCEDDADCHGPTCSVCKASGCAPVGVTDARELPEADQDVDIGSGTGSDGGASDARVRDRGDASAARDARVSDAGEPADSGLADASVCVPADEVCAGDDRCDTSVDRVGPTGCVPQVDADGAAAPPHSDDAGSGVISPAAPDGATPCVASTEVCDGRDNDCDDAIDEELTNACGRACGIAVPPEDCATSADDDCDGQTNEGCTPPPPACVAVAETCDGVDQDCDGVPDDGVKNACGACGLVPAEICDGKDNDCDGMIDEGVKNACAACGSLPTETCDGRDNDCDGQTDEGVKNACNSCGPVPAEVCDRIDNDCDGMVDEGVKNACNSCGPVPAEVCDRIDNDCDGMVDEGVKNACNSCGPVPAEVCDRIDNDCDGMVDDGVMNACGGCGAVPAEVCDGTDNDCDGTIDDGATNACGGTICQTVQDREKPGDTCMFAAFGECAFGRVGCIDWSPGMRPACLTSYTPTAEVRDRKDNDCDGRFDEDIPGCLDDASQCTPDLADICFSCEGF